MRKPERTSIRAMKVEKIGVLRKHLRALRAHIPLVTGTLMAPSLMRMVMDRTIMIRKTRASTTEMSVVISTTAISEHPVATSFNTGKASHSTLGESNNTYEGYLANGSNASSPCGAG